MADQPVGPLCADRLGTDWMDAGTMCLSRSDAPGSTGTSSRGGPQAWGRDPFASPLKLVYSRAKEAVWKRTFDERLSLAGVRVAADNGLYWRSLVGCLVGNRSCSADNTELVFYLIRGGYEGFLDSSLKPFDANRAAWDNRSEGTTDVNDALVVLDGSGALVGAFQLAVPNYYPVTGRMVTEDWDGRAVNAYYNSRFQYWGLAVIDRGKLPKYDPAVRKTSWWIDIHHKAGTFGCIEVNKSATAGTHDFDAFVRSVSARYGRVAKARFIRDKTGGYLPADDDAPETAAAFTVEMTHYLGRLYVLQLPR